MGVFAPPSFQQPQADLYARLVALLKHDRVTGPAIREGLQERGFAGSVDQAGWHVSDRLGVPANITIVPLPAKCPELNPVENVWQFLRGNWLSNRIFRSYDTIVDHCCDAWNHLAEQPWRVMSFGLRSWVPGHRP